MSVIKSTRSYGGRLAPTVVSILLLLSTAASGVALFIAGLQLDNNALLGLAVIPSAIALVMLATWIKVGPWLLPLLELTSPKVAGFFEALWDIEAQRLNYQSVFERLQTYLEQNDLPRHPVDTEKEARALLKQITPKLKDDKESDLLLLDQLLLNVNASLLEAYPTLPDMERLAAFTAKLAKDCQHAPLLTTDLSDGVRRGLVFLATAVFINKFAYDLSPLRPEIARRAANYGESFLIIIAYLELKQQFENVEQTDGKDFVTLRRLVDQWVTTLENRHLSQQDEITEGICQEIDSLREALDEGEWFSHDWQLLQLVFARIKYRLGRFNQLREKRPSVVNALKRVFNSLSLDTVERFLEARTINVYLLTFVSGKGKVSLLLNSLITPKHRNFLQTELGIQLDSATGPKYLFKQYTPNARVGFVPIGWSFQQFHETLKQDLDILFKEENMARMVQVNLLPALEPNHLHGVEITVQRFGLRDHYAYPPDDSPIRQRKATLNIRELLSEALPQEDLVQVIGYEHGQTGSIVDLMMDGPILELADSIQLTTQELNDIKAADHDLKLAVLHQCKILPPGAQAGANVNWGIRQLGRRLAAEAPLSAQAANRLATSLAQFVNDPDQGRSIADSYINTLAAVGAIA